MPRSAGIYTKPFPDVVEGTTIESAVHNGTISDIEQDLNTPRPIIAGGTGANNAHDALINLHGEESGQFVTNYDVFPFVSGSFWSGPGAIGAPDNPTGASDRYYTGICCTGAGTVTLEATDLNTPNHNKYMRHFNSTWEVWKAMPTNLADTDARYVNVTGDTMSGDLVIAPPSSNAAVSINAIASSYLQLNAPTPQQAAINFMAAGALKWQLGKQTDDSFILYDTVAAHYALVVPSGGVSMTTGKSFFASGEITAGYDGTVGTYRFGNGGSVRYLTHNSAHFVLVGGTLRVEDPGIMAGAGGATGAYYFGNTGTRYLQYDGATYIFNAAPLLVGGRITSSADIWSQTGVLRLGASGGAYIGYDAGHFFCSGGELQVNQLQSFAPTGAMQLNLVDSTTGHNKFIRNSSGELQFVNHANTAVIVQITDAGTIISQGRMTSENGFTDKRGISGGRSGSVYNHFWAGGTTELWVDATNLGNITVSSDYRIKKDVIDLPGMWDTVKALRPIKYTQAQFSPPAHVDYVKELTAKAAHTDESEAPIIPGHLFDADDIERWGFIAHELQETLTPSAATGVKDAPDEIQSPNPFTVIAALTKALQEAMARIEALEAAP